MISDISCWREKDAVANVGLQTAGEGFIEGVDERVNDGFGDELEMK